MKSKVAASLLFLSIGCEPWASVRITGQEVQEGISTLKVQAQLDGEPIAPIYVKKEDWGWFGLRLPGDAPGRSLEVTATAEIGGCAQARGKSEALEVPRLGWRHVEVGVAMKERDDVGIVYRGDGAGRVEHQMESGGTRLVAIPKASDDYFAGWLGCPNNESPDGSCLVTSGRGCVTALFGKRGRTPSGWWWENPLPQGNTLYGVWGSSETDIWAVGEGGAIVHYDGYVWSSRRSPVTKALRAVHGSAGQVWAVGDEGTVLHLKPDGTWERVLHGQRVPGALHAVHVTKGTVYAAGEGGVILEGKGGAWKILCQGTTGKDLRAVIALESGTLRAAGDEIVVQQREDGACSPQPVQGRINALWSADGKQIHGAGTGGQIWDLAGGATRIPGADSVELHGLSGRQDGALLAIGARGQIFLREMGAWRREQGPEGTEDFHLRAAWLGPDGRAWALGEGGLILSRRNGVWGTEGRRAARGKNELRGLGLLGKDIWASGRRMIPGGGVVVRRLAGQAAWVLDFTADVDLYGLSVSPGGTIWVVGKAGRVLRRHAGQQGWVSFNIQGEPLLRGVWSNDTEAWIVGRYHMTLRFGTEAMAPILVELGAENDLYALVGGMSDVWAMGAPDRVLRSSLGMPWVAETAPRQSATLEAASLGPEGEVWAAAGGCVLQRALVMGVATWSIAHCPRYALYAIAADQAGVWAGGHQGKVGRWDGKDWTSYDIGTEGDVNIKGLLMLDGDLFAVGGKDAILRLDGVSAGAAQRQ